MTSASKTLASQYALGASVEASQIQINLRKIPLLAGLNDDEMRRVSTEIRIRHFNKREVVLHKGGSGDALLFLLSGQLQVVDITEDGRAIEIIDQYDERLDRGVLQQLGELLLESPHVVRFIAREPLPHPADILKGWALCGVLR